MQLDGLRTLNFTNVLYVLCPSSYCGLLGYDTVCIGRAYQSCGGRYYLNLKHVSELSWDSGMSCRTGVKEGVMKDGNYQSRPGIWKDQVP
jgi:hypothetical protein